MLKYFLLFLFFKSVEVIKKIILLIYQHWDDIRIKNIQIAQFLFYISSTYCVTFLIFFGNWPKLMCFFKLLASENAFFMCHMWHLWFFFTFMNWINVCFQVICCLNSFNLYKVIQLSIVVSTAFIKKNKNGLWYIF